MLMQAQKKISRWIEHDGITYDVTISIHTITIGKQVDYDHDWKIFDTVLKTKNLDNWTLRYRTDYDECKRAFNDWLEGRLK